MTFRSLQSIIDEETELNGIVSPANLGPYPKGTAWVDIVRAFRCMERELKRTRKDSLDLSWIKNPDRMGR